MTRISKQRLSKSKTKGSQSRMVSLTYLFMWALSSIVTFSTNPSEEWELEVLILLSSAMINRSRGFGENLHMHCFLAKVNS